MLLVGQQYLALSKTRQAHFEYHRHEEQVVQGPCDFGLHSERIQIPPRTFQQRQNWRV